ncbi:MAG: hypothetical protein AAGI68_03285 [Planctomycetota bacterium]
MPHPPHKPQLAATLLLVTSLVCLPTTGCQTRGTSATPSQVEEWSAWRYPADAEYGRDYNLTVVQDRGGMTLTNREPNPIRDHELWINRGYARSVASIPVGRPTAVALTGFINRYQEPFPVGTLLAPDKTQQVVAVEFYNPRTRTRHKATVWPPGDRALQLLP